MPTSAGLERASMFERAGVRCGWAALALAVSVIAWTAQIRAGTALRGDAEQIAQQLMASTDEWNRGNLEGFIAPYAADCTFMTAAGPIGRDAMTLRYRDKYFASGRPPQALRFEDLDVRVLGADHALMTGRFVLTGGGLPEQSGRFTLVWRRSADGWRILHDHSS